MVRNIPITKKNGTIWQQKQTS